MKIKNAIKLLSYLFFIVFISCKDKGTETLPTKSPRDYTWTADTITYSGSFIQTWILDICGNTSDDIYGVGITNAIGISTVMWHYDGKSWADVNLRDTYGI